MQSKTIGLGYDTRRYIVEEKELIQAVEELSERPNINENYKRLHQEKMLLKDKGKSIDILV